MADNVLAIDPDVDLPPGNSPAEQRAQVTAAGRDAVIADTPEEIVRSVADCWEAKARAAQLPPEGDWRTWLILAGRGFGKTRAGAEWVRARAHDHAGVRRDDDHARCGRAERQCLTIAAAGTEPGWRRAELSLSFDGGASWSGIGRTALPATIGSAAGVLASGPAALFDRVSTVEIELAHAGMALTGADDAALLAAGNLALLGDELIQFGQADRIGDTRWRLARLLRGRRGSEWAMTTHAAGERFVAIDSATLRTVDLPMATLGGAARVSAIGPGDDGVAVTADLAIGGAGLRPPAPVGLSARRLADGTIRIDWTRRSRAGWAWIDGADAPIGEDSERYRLEILPATGTARTVEPTAPGYDYTLAAQAADGVGPTMPMTLRIAQIGTRALSLPATLTF